MKVLLLFGKALVSLTSLCKNNVVVVSYHYVLSELTWLQKFEKNMWTLQRLVFVQGGQIVLCPFKNLL